MTDAMRPEAAQPNFQLLANDDPLVGKYFCTEGPHGWSMGSIEAKIDATHYLARVTAAHLNGRPGWGEDAYDTFNVVALDDIAFKHDGSKTIWHFFDSLEAFADGSLKLGTIRKPQSIGSGMASAGISSSGQGEEAPPKPRQHQHGGRKGSPRSK